MLWKRAEVLSEIAHFILSRIKDSVAEPPPFAVLTSSVLYCCCQKDERLSPGKVQTKWCPVSPRNKVLFTSPLSVPCYELSPAILSYPFSLMPTALNQCPCCVPLHSVFTVSKGCVPTCRSSARCRHWWRFKLPVTNHDFFFPVTLRIDTTVDGFMNMLYVIKC